MSGTALKIQPDGGLVMPRIYHVPAAPDWSIADRAVEWALAHGIRLDPEQQMMLRAMLGLNGAGRWSIFEAAINAPRQNGKNEVLVALELFLLFELGVRMIVHSAHEFKTSARHFARMEMIIRQNDDLMAKMKRSEKGNMQLVGFKYAHGDERIQLQDDSMIEFRTRTKTGMKGFDDVGLLVLDEAQILSEWAHGAMLPTLRASSSEHGPMVVYAGNAPDKEKHEHAIVWTRLRERGLAGDDEDLVYMEYSLDYETPEDVPEQVAHDPEQWRKVNWAMVRGRIREDHMRKELKALGWREFCIELLGVGDYPETDMLGNTEISMEDWNEREDAESKVQDPVCLFFDVSSKRTSVSAAGLNESREWHVELIAYREGTKWLPQWLAERCERNEVVEIACDGYGPGNAVAAKVEEQTGLSVRRLKTDDFATACQQFATAVEEGDVVHIGQEDLTTSVRGARTRPLVDRWAWSRSKSKTDPGPLISASGALFSALDRDLANREELVIY